MPDIDATILREIVTKLDALHAEVRSLRRGDADPRLGAFLEAVFGWSRSEPWTVAGLLAEAQCAHDLELLGVIEELTRDAKNRCISLGLWLSRHADASANGFMLRQIERNRDGAWIYSVVLCGQ